MKEKDLGKSQKKNTNRCIHNREIKKKTVEKDEDFQEWKFVHRM